MSPYNDPRAIGKDIAETYKVVAQRLSNSKFPWTTEDARAIAISAHIEASRNGYRGPVEERAVDGPDNGPEGESLESTGNGSDDDIQPSLEPPKDYNYDSRNVASVKAKDYALRLLNDATSKEAKDEKIGLEAAGRIVKDKLRAALDERFGQKAWNVTGLKNLNSGEVSFAIDWLKGDVGAE